MSIHYRKKKGKEGKGGNHIDGNGVSQATPNGIAPPILCFPQRPAPPRRHRSYKPPPPSRRASPPGDPEAAMPGRRAIEVRLQPVDAAAPKWRMSLLENTFAGFLQGAGADSAARAVFAEGSLFSPFLFGKFFDPADAFPLWEFEPEVLLAALRRGAARTTVDWGETDAEYYLRADVPGGRKCDVEVSGDAMKVIDISGLWRAPPADGRDWRAGRWWEHGFARRVELPEDAEWRKVEAYFDDGEGSLEIKVPKAGDAHQATTA
ncbi:hypothetical protein PAHAL_3G225200 [Panicum hallii]|uniref:SHSP domain-containing protein n=2 Tax=Panicum hallii TaxID=206008 RepID=A0A2T8KJ56_9POAL|nr:hypothetical protein PAHAL_3G225200 [Panicum hallii]